MGRPQVKTLCLLTDAFGGHGGIALYNRDLLTALCEHPDCTGVVGVPRLMPFPSEPQPEKLTWLATGIAGKAAFLKTVLAAVGLRPDYDLIVCAHLNLLPVAMFLKRLFGIPVLLEIYGIDAWSRPRSVLVDRLLPGVDAFVSISEITKARFLEWAKVPEARGHILPNAIHAERYGPGPKSDALLDRYGLRGRKVIMTMGRLVSSERYKGFEEVMRILPELAEIHPGIAYLVAGAGDYRHSLAELAHRLGIADRVVFTGFVPEEEKADLFRLADVYAMPSRGEGFGFVFLEAMACGIPVIGSRVDGGQEALRGGELGALVDPDSPEELKAAILSALSGKAGVVPPGIDHFSFEAFKTRLYGILAKIR